jgi:hypothetical protein
MAGAYPAAMAVKKNKHVEEWNGLREITDKTFEFNFSDAPTFVICLMVIPFFLYTVTRNEYLDKGDRRYKDII